MTREKRAPTITWIDMPLAKKIYWTIRTAPVWMFDNFAVEPAVLNALDDNGLLPRMTIQDALIKYSVCKSKSDVRRVIKQNGLKFRVHIGDKWEPVTSHEEPVRYGTYKKSNSCLTIGLDFQTETFWYDVTFKSGYREKGWAHHIWPNSSHSDPYGL